MFVLDEMNNSLENGKPKIKLQATIKYIKESSSKRKGYG